MTGEEQSFFRREKLIEFLSLFFVHKIALRCGVFTAYPVKIAGFQLTEEEEQRVFTLGKTAISYAEFRGIVKPAFAVKVDVALKVECACAQLGGLLE